MSASRPLRLLVDDMVTNLRSHGHNTPDVEVASLLYREIVRLIGDINTVSKPKAKARRKK